MHFCRNFLYSASYREVGFFGATLYCSYEKTFTTCNSVGTIQEVFLFLLDMTEISLSGILEIK